MVASIDAPRARLVCSDLESLAKFTSDVGLTRSTMNRSNSKLEGWTMAIKNRMRSDGNRMPLSKTTADYQRVQPAAELDKVMSE